MIIEIEDLGADPVRILAQVKRLSSSRLKPFHIDRSLDKMRRNKNRYGIPDRYLLVSTERASAQAKGTAARKPHTGIVDGEALAALVLTYGVDLIEKYRGIKPPFDGLL